MSFFEHGLRAGVMSTELLIESNVSKKILFESLDIAKKFEAKYSAYKQDSLLSQINSLSGRKPLKCENSELEIFQKALEIAEISEGVFDPTVGVLTQGLYGFGTKHENIPSSKELSQTKQLLNYNNLQIKENEIFLTQKGMRLDLGGIGKGYVADKIAQHLIHKGASKALISVGGEICCFGKKYNIAIKNPFGKGNTAVIKTTKKPLSISTSGNYERFINSKENHHILDTTSAKQNNFYSSVTIIKDGIDVTTLDGVATVMFNSNRDRLKDLAKKFKLAIVAITPNKEILFENFLEIKIQKLELTPF